MIKREEIIGDCRLILGDARLVVPTFSDVDSVCADPPYGMGFKSNHRKTSHRAIANDDDAGLLRFALEIPFKHSAYIWMRWDNISEIEKPKSLITWIKNNWSMGDLEHEHARQTEVAAFYAGPEHYFPRKRPTDVVYAARTGNNFHPTEKPVSLMMEIVKHTAGTVLDYTMGSGTTGVACVKLGRKFTGIELDEEYFEIACERIRKAYEQPDMFVQQPKNLKKPIENIGFDFATEKEK